MHGTDEDAILAQKTRGYIHLSANNTGIFLLVFAVDYYLAV